ncbi:MAG: protein kinase, partial [Candidatus Eremiobacterota bacterium]
ELADILNYLHNSFHQPIVYRDLKPSNIIIKPDGKPVLVDFGIARYYNPDKEHDTFNYGSPGYAAPEQYKGRGRSTPQSDIFGLGVILFQMLTGYDPSLKPLQFPSMKQLNPLIDETLEGIVLRAIQLDPLKRYISVTDFKETLVKYKREHCFTEYKKPSWKASKWKTRSWQFACGTFIIPVILFVFPLIGSILIPDNETGYEINRIIFWLLITAMCSCPVAGLITGIIASRKVADISCEPADNAIGCNILIIIALILIHYTLIPNFLRARGSGELATCESNLKNLATALEFYSSDNNSLYPSGFNKLLEPSKNKDSYMRTIPLCPASLHYLSGKYYRDFYEYAVSEDCKNFTIPSFIHIYNL